MNKKKLKGFLMALGLGFIFIEACFIVMTFILNSLSQVIPDIKLEFPEGDFAHGFTILLIVITIWGFWSLWNLRDYIKPIEV